MLKNIILTIICLIAIYSCSPSGEKDGTPVVIYDTLELESTAYNSRASQTTAENPAIAAWGDTLKPGIHAVAISRDLLDSGLRHNSIIYIDGFDEPFLVKDKMNKRWTKKMDIYMGLNVDSARSWGKRPIEIYIPVDTIVK